MIMGDSDESQEGKDAESEGAKKRASSSSLAV
jgi:hypothetical protein